jgi:hypothetical protein
MTDEIDSRLRHSSKQDERNLYEREVKKAYLVKIEQENFFDEILTERD